MKITFSVTNGTNGTNGNNFDLPISLEKLKVLQKKKLNDERYGLGNAKSDVVLIIPYESSLSDSDKEYCIEWIKKMQQKVPGKLLLIKTTNCNYYSCKVQDIPE